MGALSIDTQVRFRSGLYIRWRADVKVGGRDVARPGSKWRQWQAEFQCYTQPAIQLCGLCLLPTPSACGSVSVAGRSLISIEGFTSAPVRAACVRLSTAQTEIASRDGNENWFVGLCHFSVSVYIFPFLFRFHFCTFSRFSFRPSFHFKYFSVFVTVFVDGISFFNISVSFSSTKLTLLLMFNTCFPCSLKRFEVIRVYRFIANGG
jgi:hypothetical protein